MERDSDRMNECEENASHMGARRPGGSAAVFWESLRSLELAGDREAREAL